MKEQNKRALLGSHRAKAKKETRMETWWEGERGRERESAQERRGVHVRQRCADIQSECDFWIAWSSTRVLWHPLHSVSTCEKNCKKSVRILRVLDLSYKVRWHGRYKTRLTKDPNFILLANFWSLNPGDLIRKFAPIVLINKKICFSCVPDFLF